ncbi:hypothetical protein SMKI_04G6860 [Saccharomyces mikatae IFO 1815]|uniref:Izh1p n=1 Tax=Saccharomyces mikatae IFO 1815 TaxID=226126 RepID=A0AA35NF25_SACMI|nr:uncharacterized protein SMKI_04G6860 [Saccharomyces mikatae IFO 1815]CAI4038342.1 hypothetical protein SMKI_04G6860 [Saccharomyces mikatae IFO 1815]
MSLTTTRRRNQESVCCSVTTGSIKVEAVSSTTVSEKKKLLHNFDELPEWQKDNDKILTGYVRETLSWKKCLYSLFYWNNETVNIYTHLVPAVIYFVFAITLTNYFLIPVFPSTSWSDYTVINIFLMGAFSCLMCSSCFHCMKQHSEKQSNFWSKLDYLGIISLISCSMIPIIYFGYFDHISYFSLFTIVTLVLATFCTVCVLHEKFNTSTFRPFRAMFFILFGFSGLLPLTTGFFKFGIQGVLNRIKVSFVFWEALFYISGAVIYGFRIPETLAPGKFDFLGSSHQIFHIMVVLGSICHLKAIIGSYKLMHSHIHP